MEGLVLVFSFCTSLYMLDSRSLCGRWNWQHFSPILRVVSSSEDSFPWYAGAFKLHLIRFVSSWDYFLWWWCGVFFQKVLGYTCILDVLLVFSSRAVKKTSGITTKFWSILSWFLCRVRGSFFTLVHMNIQFSQHHHLERPSFSDVYFWHLGKILDGYSCVGLFLGPLFCSTGQCACFCVSTTQFLNIMAL